MLKKYAPYLSIVRISPEDLVQNAHVTKSRSSKHKT